jgi:hypothetical protein
VDKLASPLLRLLQNDSALEDAFSVCADVPEWAPPQSDGPKAPLVRPINDHYENWQGISW